MLFIRMLVYVLDIRKLRTSESREQYFSCDLGRQRERDGEASGFGAYSTDSINLLSMLFPRWRLSASGGSQLIAFPLDKTVEKKTR
jgi:hypothetical protein